MKHKHSFLKSVTEEISNFLTSEKEIFDDVDDNVTSLIYDSKCASSEPLDYLYYLIPVTYAECAHYLYVWE